MPRRSRAREVVFQLLYQEDLAGNVNAERETEFIAGRLGDHRKTIEFAQGLLAGVRQHRSEIDAILGPLAKRWQLQRMAAVDRNILRIGIYEVRFADTPKAVALNEAILLAKRYGNNQSFQFVNGILDRVEKASDGSVTADNESVS